MSLLIIFIILLFIASSYFSGSETALTATNEMKLRLKAANGDKKSARLLKLVDNPDLFIPGILIANNVPNIVLPSLVTIVALEYSWPIGITTAVLTVLIIIFAEVMPKSIAAAFPERIAHIVYYPTMIILLILKPFIFLLNLLTRTVIKFLGQDPDNQITISKAEMRAMVDIAHTEGTFKNDDMYRLKSVLDFKNLNVADVLQTHRVEMKSIPVDMSFDEAREFLLANHYTRYPIYDGDVDHIVGVFHSKFILAWANNPEKGIRDYSDLDPLYVHEFNPIDTVFKRMMKEKKHIAIVLDEYGGTEGLITHEDLIETMIGQDIEDETDEGDLLIHRQTDTQIICDAKLSLHRLNNVFQTDIPEEADNLAGFIINRYKFLPEAGETFIYDNLEFKVLEVNERRVNRVEINKLED
ncbi:hemolysin family protein [Oceanobacillus polygoni]|uniref:Mg2+/Co2+ transporter CorB n=1 Tax=Oceanobacillus polygoni TaxID=1235259 RepID=A0A9X0YZL2_9BACI|nr:CNNM domain-containing protein [Oceanobacillus polygoni]MBP2079550.1 Mg2+/Co2+ transporter CorB [Oceanobacillus polygoni]